MHRYSRRVILTIMLTCLSVVTVRTLSKTPALAGMELDTQLASLFSTTDLVLLAAPQQVAANPTIHEDVADRAYTVMQSKRVEVQMSLPASAASDGHFQITLSSTLTLTSGLSPTLSLSEGGTNKPTLLSALSSQGAGKQIATGTIRPSTQKWLLTVNNLPSDPSLSVQISMTSLVGKISGVTIDPVVQVTQTTIVTASSLSTVSLKGYGAVKKLPRSSKLPCAELTMQWRPAPGTSANTPSISTVVTNSVGTIERRCLAEGVVSLTNTLPSGRYTYTLQAASGGFTNQAHAVLEVVAPPTPTFTPTPTDTATNTPTITISPTLIDTPTPTNTSTNTPIPTPTFTRRPTPTPTDGLPPVCHTKPTLPQCE